MITTNGLLRSAQRSFGVYKGFMPYTLVVEAAEGALEAIVIMGTPDALTTAAEDEGADVAVAFPLPHKAMTSLPALIAL